MGTVNQFKALLKSKPGLEELLLPASRFEICMDLNGDGKADFAYLDSSCDFTGNGELDTFAIDVGNDGEFDLYLRSTEKSMVPNEIVYLMDGTDEVIVSTSPKFRSQCEQILAGSADHLVAVLSKDFSVDDFKSVMTEYVTTIRTRLKAFWEEYQKNNA